MLSKSFKNIFSGCTNAIIILLEIFKHSNFFPRESVEENSNDNNRIPRAFQING